MLIQWVARRVTLVGKSLNQCTSVRTTVGQTFHYFVMIVVLFILSLVVDVILCYDGQNIIQAKETVPHIIGSNGYLCESHTIQTSDGYLLTLHRIPYSRRNAQIAGKRRPVIFYLHGVADTSASFLLFGSAKSPAFLLSDLGYDVWLGNMRGNMYSSSHVTMTNSDQAFWGFGLQEMATIDAPASIDYILKTTGEKTLTFVGFSLGTWLYFCMLAERPEYNLKVNAMVGLAPSAFYGNFTSIPWEIIIKTIFDTGIYKYLPDRVGDIFRVLFSTICSLETPEFIRKLTILVFGAEDIRSNACLNIQFLFFGYNTVQFDDKSFSALVTNFPQDISRKTLVQLLQMQKVGKFRKYDYGPRENMLFYNQTSPPDYNLKNVHTPLYLLHGTDDDISDSLDLQKLEAHLPKTNKPTIYELPGVNHVDYVAGKTTPIKVVNHIKNIMDRHVPRECSKCIIEDCP